MGSANSDQRTRRHVSWRTAHETDITAALITAERGGREPASSLAVDTVPLVYTFTCPNCGSKVKVRSGPHSVVPTPAAGGKQAGITIDGKAVHRCGHDALTPSP
jgi:hypothetical protein